MNEKRAARAFVRSGIGAVAVAAIVGVVSITFRTIDTASDPSPIQLAKLFTEGTFYLVAVIGLTLALYIASRWD